MRVIAQYHKDNINGKKEWLRVPEDGSPPTGYVPVEPERTTERDRAAKRARRPEVGSSSAAPGSSSPLPDTEAQDDTHEPPRRADDSNMQLLARMDILTEQMQNLMTMQTQCFERLGRMEMDMQTQCYDRIGHIEMEMHEIHVELSDLRHRFMPPPPPPPPSSAAFDPHAADDETFNLDDF